MSEQLNVLWKWDLLGCGRESFTAGPVCVREDNWHGKKHYFFSSGSASYLAQISPFSFQWWMFSLSVFLSEDQRLCHHLPKNSPSAPPWFVGGELANLASANKSVGGGLPSLVWSFLDLRYLDNSMAFILSRVPVRWLNSLSGFLKTGGIYLQGWASVVVDEQFLLCTVCCSGQSPFVVLTVFKTIIILKCLIIIILAFEKLYSQKHVTIW